MSGLSRTAKAPDLIREPVSRAGLPFETVPRAADFTIEQRAGDEVYRCRMAPVANADSGATAAVHRAVAPARGASA